MADRTDLQDQPSRYVVGIDLGTTNSAVAFVDAADERWAVQTLAAPQLVAPGQVEARETLPSFHYHAAGGEFAPGALRLPWQGPEDDYFVGTLAQTHGEVAPGRLITSAKSWLCHAGVDRTADLLPWHGAADVPRISPVEASSRYLAHIRAAWNHRFREHPLEEQDVVLTLPASFDEVARELTIKAAHLAGLPRVVLVEEPQAAFYAWIHAQGDDWQASVQPGQKILVCDIGGGTSDFTLIRVRRASDGRVQFHRVAVGEHLILGGDNLDLALAHHLERRLQGGGSLSPRQWGVLVQTARRVKETLLAADAPERMVVNLPGGGSKLIGGSLQLQITAEEARQVLVDGFLPHVTLDDKPIARRSGFQEFGLPYAPDAAMTRYLAAFLTAHRHAGDEVIGETSGSFDPARPDIVLFNGGFFASPVLRERLLEVLASWFNTPSAAARWSPVVLKNERLDLAVAHGAAYYGMVRRGQGTRISAGLARSYYIGADPSAVCLLPAGVEEGQSIDLESPQFHLRIREPVEFPLYVSSTRLTDPQGAVVPFDPEQMTSLPPIRTVLTAGKKGAAAETLAVKLHARLTEIGTIELWCSEAAGPRTWKLQFDVRSATQTDRTGHVGAGEQAGFVDESLAAACRDLIIGTFSADGASTPEGLVKRLEHATDMRRAAWPPSLLRAMWDALFEAEAGRRRGAEHEARWLYLMGYSLRPGYGMAVDDWRVAQTWRLLQGKLLHGTPTCRVEWFILWRRIAGGLSAGQQRALAEPLLANLPSLFSTKGSRKGAGSGAHELCEVLRLLGSCEWLPTETKVQLGDTLAARIPREKTQAVQEAELWTLARLGARVPMYGPLNAAVPADKVESWASPLLAMREPPAGLPFALMQLARLTGDRYRDISPAMRREVLDWLIAQGSQAHLIELVREGGQLREEEEGQMFGESLPRGLRIAL